MLNPHGVDFSAVGARLDRDWLWYELTEHAYWAKYRTRDMFDQQLDSAWRVVGAYRAMDGQMVGFCRAFSDGVAMAYLADLYVTDAERGRGIGQELLQVMIDEGPGRDFRWMLHTVDAHSLYEKFGFVAPVSGVARDRLARNSEKTMQLSCNETSDCPTFVDDPCG